MSYLIKNMAVLSLSTVLLVSCGTSKKNSSRDIYGDNFDTTSQVDHNKAAELNLELGLAYLKQGQIARSKTKLNRALELAPNLPATYYSLGYFYESVNEVQNAEKYYKQGISYGDGDGMAHHNYGTFLCRQGKYLEADRQFNIAAKDQTFTSSAELYENAGLCISGVPDTVKARQYFEKSLSYDSRRENALLELAIILYEDGELAQAKAYYLQHETIAKPSPRSLWLGIKIAQLSHNTTKVNSLIGIMQKQYPGSEEYLSLSKIN